MIETMKTPYAQHHFRSGVSPSPTFEPGKPDEHRATFEAFGVRVAMHLERRDLAQVGRVVMEAARFIHEIDHPELTDPRDLPLATFIECVRTVNMLEQADVRTAGQLADKDAAWLLQIANCAAKALEVVRAGLASIGIEWESEAGIQAAVRFRDRGRLQEFKAAASEQALKRSDAYDARNKRRLGELVQFIKSNGPQSFPALLAAFDWPPSVVKRLVISGRFEEVRVRGVECWDLVRDSNTQRAIA